MSSEDWYCPEANSEGFARRSQLEKWAYRLSPAEFIERYPRPGLLVLDPETETDDPLDGQEQKNSGVMLVTQSIESVDYLAYLNKIAFIAKRPGNLFPHLISIGRSSNNDIRINVDSVSKVHGYFVAKDGGWVFTDHGSTNGSKLDQKVLAANHEYPLSHGQQLRLGINALFEFLSPETLYRVLRGLP